MPRVRELPDNLKGYFKSGEDIEIRYFHTGNVLDLNDELYYTLNILKEDGKLGFNIDYDSRTQAFDIRVYYEDWDRYWFRSMPLQHKTVEEAVKHVFEHQLREPIEEELKELLLCPTYLEK